ncbi:hypothetical protein PG985_009418 [Apiospora marii]|uniref:uncharacterized protein n=1 Tax=Apiospora marii TaxID=335849 RepID=UPI00313278A5
MSQFPLMPLPVEIRAEILTDAIYGFSPWDFADRPTVNALMQTCKAISDELFPILFEPNGYIYDIDIAILRSGHASTSWLKIKSRVSARLTRPSVWPDSASCTFFVRDLEDQKLKSLARRARMVGEFSVSIEIPQLAAKGRSKSEDLAVIWSKVRDIATLIALFRSVRTVSFYFTEDRATKLDINRAFNCPVKVNQETFKSSLHTLIVGALADPFIKNGPFSRQRESTTPRLHFRCLEHLLRPHHWRHSCLQWMEDPEHSFHTGKPCHEASRITKTARQGVCTPQSLPERLLKNMKTKESIVALTDDELIELRHEMRTLSIAVDALIDTCRGRAANMLRLRRFATWDSPETNGMSLAAQHNLLRGVGPQDRTISNRETLMKIMKPAECDISGYPVDTWYNKYPQGIEPLDLLAKRHRECFEEEPEFEVQEITHTKE